LKLSTSVAVLTVSALLLGVEHRAYSGPTLLDNLDQPPAGYWNYGPVVGQAFTTGQAVDIESVTFQYDYPGYTPGVNAYLTIQTAALDGTIGAILDTWVTHTLDTGDALVTFSGEELLAPGTTYWLLMHDDNVTYAQVSSTTTPTIANFGATLPVDYDNYDGSVYYPLSQNPLMFKVTVPDGGLTWVLLGLGLLGVGWVRRMVK
jgi:hypothetical protein